MYDVILAALPVAAALLIAAAVAAINKLTEWRSKP